MKKFLLFVVCAALMMLCLCSCGSESKNESGPTNEEFFAITELIQNGDYEQAKSALDEAYAQTDYASGSSGFNKMNQYRSYYVSQGLYDEAMTVLLDFLKANDFVNHLAEVPADDIKALDDDCVYAIHQVNSILESVSNETKAEAIEIIGQDLLDKYETR